MAGYTFIRTSLPLSTQMFNSGVVLDNNQLNNNEWTNELNQTNIKMSDSAFQNLVQEMKEATENTQRLDSR